MRSRRETRAPAKPAFVGSVRSAIFLQRVMVSFCLRPSGSTPEPEDDERKARSKAAENESTHADPRKAKGQMGGNPHAISYLPVTRCHLQTRSLRTGAVTPCAIRYSCRCRKGVLDMRPHAPIDGTKVKRLASHSHVMASSCCCCRQ